MQIIKIREDFKCQYLITVPFWIFVYFLQICVWPFYLMLKTFVIKCQYETSSGTKKINLHKKLEANDVKAIRAMLFEGCLEASFQVTILLSFNYI